MMTTTRNVFICIAAFLYLFALIVGVALALAKPGIFAIIIFAELIAWLVYSATLAAAGAGCLQAVMMVKARLQRNKSGEVHATHTFSNVSFGDDASARIHIFPSAVERIRETDKGYYIGLDRMQSAGLPADPPLAFPNKPCGPVEPARFSEDITFTASGGELQPGTVVYGVFPPGTEFNKDGVLVIPDDK